MSDIQPTLCTDPRAHGFSEEKPRIESGGRYGFVVDVEGNFIVVYAKLGEPLANHLAKTTNHSAAMYIAEMMETRRVIVGVDRLPAVEEYALMEKGAADAQFANPSQRVMGVVFFDYSPSMIADMRESYRRFMVAIGEPATEVTRD